jgi:hypothetical protein
VALALWGSALALLVVAVVAYAGAFGLDRTLRLRVASVLGLAAAVDVLLGFVFFRSSTTS